MLLEQAEQLQPAPQQLDGLIGLTVAGQRRAQVEQQHLEPQLVPLVGNDQRQLIVAGSRLEREQARHADVGAVVGLVGVRHLVAAARIVAPNRGTLH